MKLDKIAEQYLLMLPMLDDDGKEYVNQYYTIGSEWTEWVESGQYVKPEIREEAFKDWLQ